MTEFKFVTTGCAFLSTSNADSLDAALSLLNRYKCVYKASTYTWHEILVTDFRIYYIPQKLADKLTSVYNQAIERM